MSGAALLQMLLGLTLVIGILFFGAYFLRKLNGGRSFGNTGPLRIVGGLMISTRERIVLVEVGDAWIVIGIVPGQIKTLHTLPKGELPASQSGEKPFGQWLKQMTERKNENK
ncbi:flagellar biosynthetic protein FliO [Propionivibrio sp.]|uniref:flagellar biosynthetic protein FliO n=1 Tax=Propionivibrio sp. TaxID=2212460 RepID=UPI003BF11BD5